MSESKDQHWREIAEAASNEQDPHRLLELAKKLEAALDADRRPKQQKKNPDAAHEPLKSGERAG